jgi:hypothetical protein
MSKKTKIYRLWYSMTNIKNETQISNINNVLDIIKKQLSNPPSDFNNITHLYVKTKDGSIGKVYELHIPINYDLIEVSSDRSSSYFLTDRKVYKEINKEYTGEKLSIVITFSKTIGNNPSANTKKKTTVLTKDMEFFYCRDGVDTFFLDISKKKEFSPVDYIGNPVEKNDIIFRREELYKIINIISDKSVEAENLKTKSLSRVFVKECVCVTVFKDEIILKMVSAQ